MRRFNDKINDKLLFENFNCVLQKGTQDLLELSKRKETLSFDWPERDGSQRDLSRVHFNDNEITLQLAIMADNDTEFWLRYNGLITNLSKSGWQKLYIQDHQRTYKVSYLKSSSFKKVGKRLKNVAKVFVKFSVTLLVEFNSIKANDRVYANLEDYTDIQTFQESGFKATHKKFRFHADTKLYKKKARNFLSRENSVVLEDKTPIEIRTGTGQHISLPDGYLNNRLFQIYVIKNTAPNYMTLWRALRSLRKKRVEIVVFVIRKGEMTTSELQANINRAYEKFKKMFAYRYKEIRVLDKETLDLIYPNE